MVFINSNSTYRASITRLWLAPTDWRARVFVVKSPTFCTNLFTIISVPYNVKQENRHITLCLSVFRNTYSGNECCFCLVWKLTRSRFKTSLHFFSTVTLLCLAYIISFYLYFIYFSSTIVTEQAYYNRRIAYNNALPRTRPPKTYPARRVIAPITQRHKDENPMFL